MGGYLTLNINILGLRYLGLPYHFFGELKYSYLSSVLNYIIKDLLLIAIYIFCFNAEDLKRSYIYSNFLFFLMLSNEPNSY